MNEYLQNSYIFLCSNTQLIYVHRHINDLKEVANQKWDGEEEPISISGPEKDPSATCHHGSDRDAALVSAEADKHAQGFLGFQEGGGQTQHTSINQLFLHLPYKMK
jgi:hypothetical protein